MLRKGIAIVVAFVAVFTLLFGFADVPVYADDGVTVVGYTNEHWRLDVEHIRLAVNNLAGDPANTTNAGSTARTIVGDIEFFSCMSTMAQTFDATRYQRYTLTRIRSGTAYTLTCYNGKEGPWQTSDGTKVSVTFDAANTTTWEMARAIADTWSHDVISSQDASFFESIGNFFRTVITYVQIGFTYVRMFVVSIFDTVKLTLKVLDVPLYLLGIGDLLVI